MNPSSPVTVITGAAAGIGRRLALDLVKQSRHRLVLCDLDEAGLESAFGGAATTLRRLDVTRLEDWQALFDEVVAEHGRVDQLYNIAGILTPGWLHKIDAGAIDRHVDVNIKGVMYGSKLASEVMIRQGSGHIVNMSSLAGIGFTPGNTLYCGSKHAVRGFSVALAAEVKDKGVCVSCVCPGVAETAMLEAQVNRPEGALSFTTGAPLTTEQVSQLLQKAVAEKSVEACMPNPFFSKLINAFPALSLKLYDTFQRRGLKAAARVRHQKRGLR